MMEEYMYYIETHAVLFSTLSAIISAFIVVCSLVFTVIYVRATIQLVHTPFKAFLIVKDLKFDNSFNFILENNGPGLAYNIQLKYESMSSINKVSDNNQRYEYKAFITCKKCYQLRVGEIGKTEEVFFPIISTLIQVEWTTQTGKVCKSYFKYIGGATNFRLATRSELLNLYIYKLKKLINSPYYSYKYNEYFEEKIMCDQIISYISNNQDIEHTVDTLADNFNNRSDEQVNKVIQKMIKKRMVKQIGYGIELNKIKG